MKKILLTGFAPFAGESVNPSQKLIESLSEEDHAWVDTLLLPVSFKRAPEILFQSLNLDNYDLILMLGQAGGRSKISLERVALNWVETENSDENGYTPKTGVIDSTGEKAFFSRWPLPELKKQLDDKKIPVEISFSAGSYVCNYLYYRVATEILLMGSSSLFVHVPFLPEQIKPQDPKPSMDFAVMKEGLEEILKFFKARPRI